MNIKIADRTLCQEDNSYSFKEKLEIARQLEKLNVNAIELPQIENIKADTLLVRTIASFVKSSVISVATGASKQGVENAAAALNTAANKRIRVELPVSTVGMEYTLHIKADKMVTKVAELVSLAKEKCQSVEFCAVDATRAEKDDLKAIILSAAQNGADIITLCDTSAEMMPQNFGAFVAEIKEMVKEYKVEIGVLSSNLNGLAAADAIAGVQNGAEVVKTDVKGNDIPLETFAGIIKNCGNKCDFQSDIKYTELNRIVKQIDWIIGNAKNEKSVVTVAEVDESGIRLDVNDDKSVIVTAVGKLGYDLSDEDQTKVYEEFQRVAAKKTVGAKELEAIVASVALQVEPTYKLINYIVNSGNVISSSAQVTIEKQGETLQGISIGDGPVAAAFLAIEQIIGHHYDLDDFQIQSVTEGKEAMGSALVKLRSGGKLYSGNGISTDIIGAAIRAYINAVNKIVYEEA